MELLAAAPRPLAVSELLGMLPGTAISTLYRDLALLEEAGAVERLLGIGAVAYFELRDPGGRTRHHLVCGRCGPVTDVLPADDLAGRIFSAAADAARDRGFLLRAYRLDALGLCRLCRAAASEGGIGEATGGTAASPAGTT